MDTVPPTEDAITRGRVRTIVRVRWLGVVFGIVQVLSYGTLPYPEGLREGALGLVAALALGNLAFEVVLRRPLDRSGMLRVGLVMLALDVLALSGITWMFAFDSLSALFAILFLLPIEAAVLFGLPGALWTWAVVAALYAGREWFGTRYGNPFELESVTFRLGLIGIVALIVGLLVRDLVAQRRATAAALREAERLEESRTRLIAMLAHDVRAPIASARTAFDTVLAAGDRIAAAQRAEVLEAGRRQSDRALMLARDLLDLARVETGTLTVDRVDVDVATVVARVLDVLPATARVVVDLDHAVLRADPDRLEQVLFNLIDNAVKYGAEPIEVAARRDGQEVVLSVRDHGPGVPDEVELFTPFSHAGEGSVGLGMWIVQHLVDAMGGTVAHEPATPGARFVVRLPAGVADGSAATAGPAVSERT